MQRSVRGGIVTALVLSLLALGGAGCYYNANDEDGTRFSIHINLLPDDGEPGGMTIHFETDR
ncbi:MAG TPA: hypothetical protein PLM14_15120 [Candidatus Hydrogenedentes bacterium]|nr:hypothetical protein [Candidatus Hydrogenedentota bacterium]HQH54072.1 hypothetical protein [Candidatus Hydrogenedentota bacterium]